MSQISVDQSFETVSQNESLLLLSCLCQTFNHDDEKVIFVLIGMCVCVYVSAIYVFIGI